MVGVGTAPSAAAQEPASPPAAKPAAAAPAGEPSPAHPAPAVPVEPGHGAPPAAADAHGAQEGHGESEAAHESPWALVARLFNFAVLAGGLGYLLRGPLSRHLQNRRQQISGDLDAARATTASATRQIQEIDRRLAELPAELEALRAKGVEEIAAEEASIRERAESERQRLLAQMRRDIEIEVRLARRALTEHAADLAVTLASDRIDTVMTDDDRERLLDRYVSRVRQLHG